MEFRPNRFFLYSRTAEGGGSVAKSDTMLEILWILNSETKTTAKYLAEKLEINIRTVYRYIDSLCASGVPIVSDAGRNGGYSLPKNFVDAPLLFSVEEQRSLLHATVFAKEAGYPFGEEINNAARKIKTYTNREQESVLNHQLSGFEVVNNAINRSGMKVLEELKDAIANEHSVEIEYRTVHEEQAQKRVVDPYGILFWYNKWYLVGFCHLRNGIRSFRIERILQLKQTQMEFKRPEAFSAKEFFLQNIVSSHETDDKKVSVVINGKADAIGDLCNHWYLGQHIKERTSNQAIFLVDESAIHTYMSYFLLSYGKAIQVIEPQSLRKQLVSVASELADFYRL